MRALGSLIYNALDYGKDTSVELEIGHELEELIMYMISKGMLKTIIIYHLSFYSPGFPTPITSSPACKI